MSVSHLADTFVVKETQSVTKDSGVVPVMSSHWAGDVPPVGKQTEIILYTSHYTFLLSSLFDNRLRCPWSRFFFHIFDP